MDSTPDLCQLFPRGLKLDGQGLGQLPLLLLGLALDHHDRGPQGGDRALAYYEKETLRSLAAWQRVIGWFYDGRLLTLFQVGQYVRGTLPGRLLDFHFRKHMPRIFTGEDTTSRYSLGLVGFMVKHGLVDNDPRELEVR